MLMPIHVVDSIVQTAALVYPKSTDEGKEYRALGSSEEMALRKARCDVLRIASIKTRTRAAICNIILQIRST